MMKKNSSLFLTKILALGLIFVIGYFAGYKTSVSQISPEIKFPEIEKILDTYLQKPSPKKQEQSLMRAFVDSYGDTYTTYFSPEETLSFDTMIQGDFEGIGAYVEDDNNGIYISGVLPGSPAQESGLLPGDIIQAVDGETMYAKSADEAVKKIRGPAGTPVVLDIFSTVLSTKKKVTLIRKHLEIPIISDELRGDVLVIHLFSFNDYSRDDVAQVLTKHAGKYTSILLDLRNNGGGTLQSAVDVGSLFLASGKLIASVDGREVTRYISHGTADVALPLAILVNGHTASAAEILTSALHTHLGAPVFGSQTYGKGSVQQLFPLSNGGELKVTIAHWRTADNILLDGVGITPDTVILPTPEELTAGRDGQLEKVLVEIKK